MKSRTKSNYYNPKRKRTSYRGSSSTGGRRKKYTTDDGISKLLNFQWAIVVLSICALFMLKAYLPQTFSEISEHLSTLITEESVIDVQAHLDNISEQCANIIGEPKNAGMGGLFPVKTQKRAKQFDYLAPPKGASFSPVFLTASPKLPLEDIYVTSRYGYRMHPITDELDFHTGTDIAAPQGTPIHSILYGKIKEVGESDILGNYIVVEHSPNLKSVYCHCSEIIAPIGAYVKQGDRIALVGSTGVSTGPHLHLEIIVDSCYTDPGYIFEELKNEN